MMTLDTPLKDKVILVVDDEPDVIETIEEMLDMCLLHKAADYDTAFQYLMNYTYDIVVLDIMGVRGFELLKISASMDFPTVMLTANALTPEALTKSINLGAVFFLPKEKMADLKEYLEDVVLNGGKSMWLKFFDQLGSYFNKRFGSDWKEKDKFFKEYEKKMKLDSKKSEQFNDNSNQDD